MNYEDMIKCLERLNNLRKNNGLEEVNVRNDDEMFKAIVFTLCDITEGKKIIKEKREETEEDEKTKKRPGRKKKEATE